MHNHQTNIPQPFIDSLAWEKVMEVLNHPELIHARIDQLRTAHLSSTTRQDLERTLENIRRVMQNLYRLAEQSQDDDTLATLTHRMQELEQQKRQTEALLFDIEEAEEERATLAAELQKFDAWVENVRPFLTDLSYVANASYEEKRLAIRILGVRATIFPVNGQWPSRYQITITVPGLSAQLPKRCVYNENSVVLPAREVAILVTEPASSPGSKTEGEGKS